MRIFELTEFINLKLKDLRHQVANIKGLENQRFFKNIQYLYMKTIQKN